MSNKKMSKKLLLKDLSRSPADSFNALVRSLNKKWCAVSWDGDFSVIGRIFIDNDCIKIISVDNELTFIRIDMVHAITPLSAADQEEASKDYFELIFKQSWDA